MDAICYIVTGVTQSIDGSNATKYFLGTLFVTLIGSIVWRSQQLWTDSRKAGQAIIDAFMPELNSLIDMNYNTENILTDEVLKKHNAAIRNNIQKLLWYKRLRLSRAWNEMCQYKINNKHRMESYLTYFDGGSNDVKRKLRPLAIARIKKIISIVC